MNVMVSTIINDALLHSRSQLSHTAWTIGIHCVKALSATVPSISRPHK